MVVKYAHVLYIVWYSEYRGRECEARKSRANYGKSGLERLRSKGMLHNDIISESCRFKRVPQVFDGILNQENLMFCLHVKSNIHKEKTRGVYVRYLVGRVYSVMDERTVSKVKGQTMIGTRIS